MGYMQYGITAIAAIGSIDVSTNLSGLALFLGGSSRQAERRAPLQSVLVSVTEGGQTWADE